MQNLLNARVSPYKHIFGWIIRLWLQTSYRRVKAKRQHRGALPLLSGLVGTDKWIKFFIRLFNVFFPFPFAQACSGLSLTGQQQCNIIWLSLLQGKEANSRQWIATPVCADRVSLVNIYICEHMYLHALTRSCIYMVCSYEWSCQVACKVWCCLTGRSIALRTNGRLESADWNWAAAR